MFELQRAFGKVEASIVILEKRADEHYRETGERLDRESAELLKQTDRQADEFGKRLDRQQDVLDKHFTDHGNRLRAVERKIYYASGIFVTALAVGAYFADHAYHSLATLIAHR